MDLTTEQFLEIVAYHFIKKRKQDEIIEEAEKKVKTEATDQELAQWLPKAEANGGNHRQINYPDAALRSGAVHE